MCGVIFIAGTPSLADGLLLKLDRDRQRGAAPTGEIPVIAARIFVIKERSRELILGRIGDDSCAASERTGPNLDGHRWLEAQVLDPVGTGAAAREHVESALVHRE